MKRPFKVLVLSVTISIIPCIVMSQHFGQKSHEIHSGVDNMKIMKYWDTNTEGNIKIYEAIDKVLSTTKNASYADVLENEDYIKLRDKYKIKLLGGPMLGNVKYDGVAIWIRTAKPSKVHVEVNDSTKTIKSISITTSTETDLAGVIKIDNLKSNTTYSYKVVVDGEVISNEDYAFTTSSNLQQSSNTRIVFGSCPHRWGLGNVKLFETIKERKPNAMFLLGDIVVQDRDNHLGKHRADHQFRDLQTAWSDFASSVPVYANWDDHDYFGNDKSGIPKGFTDQDRRHVRQVFKNNWANPDYGLNGEGIFFKTQIGSAEVVMTDNRYFREDDKGVFLGEKQMDWLKSQIKNCKSPFLVISCGTMWSDYVSNGKDSWGGVDPEGRKELFKLIEENKVSAVILISGDRHGARGFTINTKSGFKLYEFEAASLGARVGPPKSKPEWTSQLYGIDGTFAFGELTFDTTCKDPKMTFRLIDEEGNIIKEITESHSELTSK